MIHMTIEELQDQLKTKITQEAIDTFRETLSREILVGPFGDGYAIFFCHHKVGYWKTREDACDVAEEFKASILDRSPLWLRNLKETL